MASFPMVGMERPSELRYDGFVEWYRYVDVDSVLGIVERDLGSVPDDLTLSLIHI